MKELNINGTIVKEGSKYRHIFTNTIYTIVCTRDNKFKFDNGVISVSVTEDRLKRVELV